MKKIIGLALGLLLLFACGPVFRTVVRMGPVACEDGSFISLDGNSITSVKDGVKISARFLDLNDLKKLGEPGERNPYAGNEKTFFTVFEVVIENGTDDKISMDPSKCAVLDGLGNQYNAFTAEYFKDLYPSTTVQYLSRLPASEQYQTSLIYTDDYYRRKTVDQTILKQQDIYAGVKQKGVLVFEQVGREVPGITLIIPGVSIWKNGVELKRLDFRFKFIQEVKIERE